MNVHFFNTTLKLFSSFFTAMLFNRVVSGVTFAIPATKSGGDLNISFSVLDIDLSMSCTS